MNALAGCAVEALDSVTCLGLLSWVCGDRSAARATSGPGATWLLAHSDDGVTWGKRSPAGWQTGAEVFPQVSPPITVSTLLELRLFGEEEEIFMWRSRDGLRGRKLQDIDGVVHEAVRPKDEIRVLVGDHLVEPSREGFSRVGSATGAEQVVPLSLDRHVFDAARWPLRLQVRHYFQEDRETGAVRIAATRLVDVRVEGKGAR